MQADGPFRHWRAGYPEATERYMRLALRAQAQAARTIEVLAGLKNPPVVFAKQANIANGPQQVNNGASFQTSTRERAPAQEIRSPQNELLEVKPNEQLDTRATRPTGGADQAVAALDKVDRADHT